MPRLLACAAALILVASVEAFSTGRTRTFAPDQIKGFRIWESGPRSLLRSPTPGNVRRGFYVRFANETREEVAEVDVRLRVSENGRTTYLSPATPLRQFDNAAFPQPGSLLPFNKSVDNTFVIDYPGRYWNVGSRDDVEIVSIKVFTGEQDLHDLGHLCAFVMNSPDKAVLARLKSQPDLLKVRNAQNMNVTLLACAVGSPEVIGYVLAHGGSLGAKTMGGSTAAHVAAFNTNAKVLGFLQANGIPMDSSNATGRTPLIKAIQVGNQPATHWLLAHGSDPNHRDREDRTPMYYAITEGQTQIVEALVRTGANPRYHNRNGWGWMHTAAVHNHLILPWMLRAGVSVNDVDPRFGLTPLMAVAGSGSYDSIPWLLAHGANPAAKDRRGMSAYDYAREANTLGTDRFFRKAVESATR